MKKNKINITFNGDEVITIDKINEAIDNFYKETNDENFFRLCFCLRNQYVYFVVSDKFKLIHPAIEIEDDYHKENDYLLYTIPVVDETCSWLIATPTIMSFNKELPLDSYLGKTKFKNLLYEMSKYKNLSAGVVYNPWEKAVWLDKESIESFLAVDRMICQLENDK